MKSNIYIILYIVAFFLLLIFGACESKQDIQIINMFEMIDSIPVSISSQNSLEVNNKGGHLQGIQYYKYNQSEYYFVTGSSNTYSYISVVKRGDMNSVISINKILDNPFKHAGGFQIYNNYMAIGIEDNSGREKSKVFVYQINNPEELPDKPIKIIERRGAYERATAGCVGIIEVKGDLLVVVGDWDTEHLDFYSIGKNKLGSSDEAFKLLHSIAIDEIDKSKWIDNSWLSYQNINFIKDSSGKLYLAGMASNDNEENILDLFSVETEDLSSFNLIKVYTKRFMKNEEINFDWGSGVYMTENNMLEVFSCSAHIQKESRIFIFK